MRTSLFLAGLLAHLPASAAPGVIPLHGNLRDLDGNPIDGDVAVEFTLYGEKDAPTGIYTVKVNLEVVDGNFSYYLGADKPLDLDLFADDPDVFLGMVVDGDELPTVRLGSVAYAAHAQQADNAETLDGLTPDDLLDAVPSQAEIERFAQGVCYDSLEELKDSLDGEYGFTFGEGLEVDGVTLEVAVDEGDLLVMLDDDYLPIDYVPSWKTLKDIPSGFADGKDDDTTYTAGPGLGTKGTEFFVVESDIRKMLDDDYLIGSSYKPAWSDLTGIPSGFSDGKDDDTTYSAGTGLTVSGTTFALDRSIVELYAKGVAYDTESELTALLDDNYLSASYRPAWSSLTGVPSDLADGDDDTTYTAGTGLDLSGTTFSLDKSTVETYAKGVAYDTESELTTLLDDNYLSKAGGTLSGALAVTGRITATSSIQVGADSATCSSSNYGAVRWTSTKLEVCNASGWTELQTNVIATTDPFPGSKVISAKQGSMVNGWIGNPQQEWKLCYRRSDHGASGSTFHSRCDNLGDTVTVLTLDNGLIIGGYAGCEWESSGSYRYQCAGSFLFSITGGHKYNKRFNYQDGSTMFGHNYWVYDGSSYGPTWGGGHDLYISSDMTTGYCNLGHDYTCRVNGSSSYGYSGYQSSTCQNDFCGSYSSWKITELEVWYK